MNCKVCQNMSGKNPDLSFFRFPSDYNRCREWAERCDIMEIFEKYGPVKFYKSFRICSEHFDTKYIVFDGRKKKLVNYAVPRVAKANKVIKRIQSTVHKDTGLRVTQKLLENLCRFCAEENTELTDIFSRRGKTLELEEKIRVFPITVNKLDKLPLKICNPCIVKISKFHEFVRNCVKADIRLKTILGTADVSSVDDKVGFADELKPIRNLIGSGEESQKSDTVNSSAFLFLDEIPSKDVTSEFKLRKDEDERRGSQPNHHAPDASFSYISSEEAVLLTKTNDVFGKKICVSSEGNTTFERYICNVCSKTFNRLEILESHWKAHSLQPDEHGRFACQTCNKLFPNKYRLNEHNRVHTGDYPFKCNICDKKFHKMSLLKQHSIVHESNKRFVCSICNLRSSRKGNLIQHLKTHSLEVLKKNSRQYILLPHMDCANSNGFEILNHIPKRREQDTSMVADPFENDATDEVKVIRGTCRIQVLDLETLEEHMKSQKAEPEHNLSQSPDGLKVGACEKPKSNDRKRAHQRTYQCEECGVHFKRKDTLTNHVRIHTGERPFVCGSCGFAFKQKGDCLKHERNHQKRSEEACEKYS